LSAARSADYFVKLVQRLCAVEGEREWVEFKENNVDPQLIGEYISALSNAAALAGQSHGYLVWGVRDEDRALVGTRFEPQAARKGNEALISWLARLLEPGVEFAFHPIEVDGHAMILLEIPAATRAPVRFHQEEYIRVGSAKKKLKDYPEKERALWRLFEQASFEEGIAAEHLPPGEVLQLLNLSTFCSLTSHPVPDGYERSMELLQSNRLVAPCAAGGWDITNLGALLLANRLGDFDHLRRRAVRAVVYRAQSRLETERELEEPRGYAMALPATFESVMRLLPAQELADGAFQRAHSSYPDIAVRELIANALIHQDFSIKGAGPMVEIFSDRLEVTNPGEPLVPTERFLDAPPRSRNDALASMMRRLNLCEERGSGIDKVMFHLEAALLPAPDFRVVHGFTHAILFGPRKLTTMERPDRTRICYWHACLRYLQRDAMTNTSLRERFGMDESARSLASRYIREACEDRLIRQLDPDSAPKYMKYVPCWA
jgi:ATP-dependent DNA helicase RecG